MIGTLNSQKGHAITEASARRPQSDPSTTLVLSIDDGIDLLTHTNGTKHRETRRVGAMLGYAAHSDVMASAVETTRIQYKRNPTPMATHVAKKTTMGI